MDKQETREQPQDGVEKFIVGKFAARQDAEVAAKLLEETGFLTEQIQVETLALKQNMTLPESKAVEGGKGGAFVGAALGATIGLSVNLIVKSVPDINLTIHLPPLLMVIIGGIIGSLAIGLIGAISGGQVPKTDLETDKGSLPFNYGLSIVGKKEDLSRATQILHQQGIQI